MTREEALTQLRLGPGINEDVSEEYNDAVNMAIEALEQEPCEDVISRESIKQKLQKHHDFFVNAYGGFSNLPQNDKSRVDEITNCIAMVVNEPSVTPQEPKSFEWCDTCKEYDQENHCCHRWTKVIKNTVEEMKQEYIEREVLDKIRAQLKSHLRGVEITLEVLVENDPLRPKMEGAKDTLEDCLELIDKAESKEETE